MFYTPTNNKNKKEMQQVLKTWDECLLGYASLMVFHVLHKFFLPSSWIKHFKLYSALVVISKIIFVYTHIKFLDLIEDNGLVFSCVAFYCLKRFVIFFVATGRMASQFIWTIFLYIYVIKWLTSFLYDNDKNNNHIFMFQGNSK